MNFLRQLASMFTGGSAVASGGDRGHYYYVRCNRCGEVIRTRIDPLNDLSHLDDNEGLFTRKVIVGKRCYNRIEGEFDYDSKRKLVEAKISGGTLVDQTAYDLDQEAEAEKSANQS